MVAPEPPLTKFTKNSSNGETRTALKKKASMAKVSENFPKNGDSVKNLCDLKVTKWRLWHKSMHRGHPYEAIFQVVRFFTPSNDFHLRAETKSQVSLHPVQIGFPLPSNSL